MAIKPNSKGPLLGGSISAVVTLGGAWLIGRISGVEASILLQDSIPTVNMLCNTIILASATILALILALLGMSIKTNSKLKEIHYKRIHEIARFDTILFIATMVIFLLMNIPITESDKMTENSLKVAYYLTLGGASLLGGMQVAVVLMLYGTVTDIIHIVGFRTQDHPLIAKDDETDKENQNH